MARWMVTGCASGFGRGLAIAAANAGHDVVGLDVDRAGLETLSALLRPMGPRVRLEVGDVRVGQDVSRVFADEQFDVVVANAGHAVFGTVAEADSDAVEDLFDVNVFGVARTIRAALPGLRARKGTAVFLSSVAGRMVFPESGWYAATKHAVEALAEATWLENHSFGVRVRVVEPGAFATGFGLAATRASSARPADSVYESIAPAWETRKADVLERPQDPDLVVQAILAGVADSVGFRRIPVGLDAGRLLGLVDAVGPDGAVQVAGARLGHSKDLLAPKEVLDGVGGNRRHLTRLAARFGHLQHWATEPVGSAALEVLAREPVDGSPLTR